MKQLRKLRWSFRAEAGLKGGKAAGGNPSVCVVNLDFSSNSDEGFFLQRDYIWLAKSWRLVQHQNKKGL